MGVHSIMLVMLIFRPWALSPAFTSGAEPRANIIPTLFTRMCRRLNRTMVLLAMRWQSSSLLTTRCVANAVPGQGNLAVDAHDRGSVLREQDGNGAAVTDLVTGADGDSAGQASG
ncbi:hypothetical protein BDV12DRAFT_199577 [Aspergillus spectabilis]